MRKLSEQERQDFKLMTEWEDYVKMRMLQDEIDKLKAENEKLRKELENVKKTQKAEG